MNILIYFENEINSQRGGTERSAENLAFYLKSQQHNIILLAKNNSGVKTMFPTYYLPSYNINDNINVEFVKNIVKLKSIDCIINEGGNTADVNLFNHSKLNEATKIITCLHFSPKQAFNRYWYADIKVNNPYSILKLIHRGLYKNRFINYLKTNYRIAIEKGDYFVVLSEFYKQEISQMLCLNETLKNKIKVIPNFKTFNTPGNISSDGRKENLVIFVGRISYSTKRVDRVLRIWKKIEQQNNDWFLEIVGDGPDLDLFKKMALDLSLRRIKFCGQQDSLSFYQRAKLLFLTSNYEAMPMVIPEAMSMGCVPIVFDSFGGARESIKNGINGYLIRPFDISKFVLTVINLINNSKKLSEMSNAAMNSMYLYDYKRIADLWDNIIYGK